MPLPEHIKGQTVNGHPYVIAQRAWGYPALKKHYEGAAVVFLPHEVHALKGLGRVEAELVLRAKNIFEGEVIETRRIDEERKPTGRDICRT